MSSQYMSSPEYLDYLVKNCGVRGYDFDDRVEVCARPDVDIVLRYAKWLEIRPGDRVLEVGCGLGRILKELHEEYGISPSGVDSFADWRRLQSDAAIERDFRAVPGQGSGVAFGYFKMLCGDDAGIKLDRHIHAFMNRHGIGGIAELKQVAAELEITPRKLDYAIWQKMSRPAA